MCSLSKFYTMLGIAIGLLVVAIIAALIPYNVPGLIVAIAAVISVSVLISLMRGELAAYNACMGPSMRCGVNTAIDVLGQAASVLSVVSFAAALALEIPAVAASTNWFTGWLGTTLESLAYGLKLTGVAGCVAALGVLIGLATNVKAYEDCRNAERAPAPPVGAAGGALTSPPLTGGTRSAGSRPTK